MENIYNCVTNHNCSDIKRTVIPDNEYLPFVKVKETIVDMSPGDIIGWPSKKANTVRLTAGKVGRALNRVYRCAKNRKEDTIDVCRIS